MKNIFEGSTIYQEPKKAGVEIEVEQVMREVALDMKKIIDQLQEGIAQHDYQVVLGIDGGGRVPGLIMGQFLKEVYEHDGVKPPKTTFVAGSRYSQGSEKRSESLAEYFQLPVFQAVKASGKKVLLIDDVVATGRSIEGMIEELQKQGIAYTIAALSRTDTYLSPIPMEVVSASDTVSTLYGNRVMSGVHKKREEIFSQTLRRPLNEEKEHNNIPSASDYGLSEDGPDEEQKENNEVYASDREVLRRTRQLVTQIADELAKEYLHARESFG